MKDQPAGVEPGDEPADVDVAARFVAELADHWQRYGKAAFDAALSKDPVRYVTLAAKLIAGDGPSTQGQIGLVALLAGMGEGE